MTWSYTVSDLATSAKDQTRLLIGDINPNDQQLQDEELNFFLTLRASVWGAAAQACFSLASQFSRRADTVTGELHTLYSAQAKAYAGRNGYFETMAAARGGSLPSVGGISIAAKVAAEIDPDRVAPNFSTGITDNTNYPVSPAGNEPSTPRNDGGPY
jgi:hypothetical protein